MITDKNISILLQGRKIVDDYNIKVKRYGDLPYLIEKVENDLSSLEFTLATFLQFDQNMVLYEIDECYRIRRKDNPDAPALCDECIGRAPKCYLGVEANCFQGKASIPPMNESKIAKEYIDASIAVDFDYMSHPEPSGIRLLQFLDFANGLPNDCFGFFRKIKEPRFELFWQDFKNIRWQGKAVQDQIESRRNL
jgi:hypothetical protein